MNIIVKFPTFAPGIPELSPQRYAHPPRLRPRPQHPRKTLPRRHPPRIRLHPLSRRPHRKLLHGQQTGSRLPPLTRRQTRNNRNHHRRHRKVCAHLGIRLVPVNVYSSPYTFPSCVTFNCELPLVETESEIYTMSSRLYPLFASSSTITFPSLK